MEETIGTYNTSKFTHEGVTGSEPLPGTDNFTPIYKALTDDIPISEKVANNKLKVLPEGEGMPSTSPTFR